ncbi:MAG: phage tail protein I [Clostridiaceae bacterium]|nr:phage tail protein I [Clostridiaceae bacterium]
MIKLKDAEIINSLPSIIGNQAWAKAISFATSQMFKLILTMADATQTFSKVDELDHDVLDILATDLRVSNYSQAYSLDLKRKLVKFALQYWATAGTKAATEEVVKAIFGDASISEWFEYGGEPGYFKISITDTALTDADVLEFKRVAENVKRLSAWLDKIVLEMKTDPLTVHLGIIELDFTAETIKQKRDGNEFYAFFTQFGAVEEYAMKGD